MFSDPLGCDRGSTVSLSRSDPFFTPMCPSSLFRFGAATLPFGSACGLLGASFPLADFLKVGISCPSPQCRFSNRVFRALTAPTQETFPIPNERCAPTSRNPRSWPPASPQSSDRQHLFERSLHRGPDSRLSHGNVLASQRDSAFLLVPRAPDTSEFPFPT